MGASGQKMKEKRRKKSDSGGFIFMCNGRTKAECYRYRVLGMPRAQLHVVREIKPGTKLFLYDFDVKLLYGVYQATSFGNLDLEPTAFNAKFPSQIRFKIFKECLPLHHSAFKVAIRDNYQGFKFRQHLNSTQVKDLVSLFRPLVLTAPTSDRPLLSNVARTHDLFPPQIMEERFQRHPTKQGVSSLQLLDTQSKQTFEPSLHDQYQPIANVEPPIQNWHVAHQKAALTYNADSYYPAGAQIPYVYQRPSSSLQDSYARDSVVEYPSEYMIPLLPKTESEIATRANQANHDVGYYGQNFPSTTSHISLQSQALPPSYTPPLPAGRHAEELVLHEPYYPTSLPENVNWVYVDPLQRPIPGSSEANVPVTSQFPFAGAAPTYH